MDLIERQAAIDAIWDRCDSEKHGRTAKTEEIVWEIEKLPSAQPEPKQPENGSTTCINQKNIHVRTKGDLISRSHFINSIELLAAFSSLKVMDNYREGILSVLKLVKEEPSADVPGRNVGKWEMLSIPISPLIYRCTFCNYNAPRIEIASSVKRHYESLLTPFCPNCGADMRGDKDGSDKQR